MKHVSKVLPAVFLLVLASADAMAAGSLLRITCEGADARAEVTINGVFKGECPIDVQVNAGSIELRVVKRIDAERERLYEETFRIGDGVVKKVEASLTTQLTAEGARRQRERDAARAQALAEERRRSEEALRELNRAADAGDANAMAELAERYATGSGVPKNEQQANALNRKAADAGSALAAFRLSRLYRMAKKDDIADVVRMLSLPPGEERVVNIEGGEHIRSFVQSDPFFEVPGGNSEVSFTTDVVYNDQGAVERSAYTCVREGRLFRRNSEHKAPNWSATIRETGALGGLAQLQTKLSRGLFDNSESEWTRIERVVGQPFPLAADKRFGLTYRVKASGGDRSYRLACAVQGPAVMLLGQAQIKTPVTPVVCLKVSDDGYLDRIDRYFWHEGSGCFVRGKTR
ncbi:MAG: hypothetical protein ACM3SS_16805 [Rhodospirillaceae bacterium]